MNYAGLIEVTTWNSPGRMYLMGKWRIEEWCWWGWDD